MTTAASIGKFQVIGQLGRGGMADVYVCRLQGIGGFDKEVVLKRIIPERAGDPHFVKMFLDEARMVANLNHPNIVQVFEIGEQDGIPFMAMEYVKGVTLGMIIREAHRQGKNNYGHSANIISGICDALEYAHNANGPDGQPLGLVHRDVTPGNIVVSREGTAKLLDFGVARAKDRLSQTEAGTIKGKIRYMAPEQVSQGHLDHRADIFALGVCLFELTTGQHPFGPRGGNEVAALKNIMHGVVTKPSTVNPDFPPALEWIIMSAIEQDVNKRCPSAGELRERLDAFVAESNLTTNAREVAAWLKDLFPDFGNLTKTGGLMAFTGTSLTPGGRPMIPGSLSGTGAGMLASDPSMRLGGSSLSKVGPPPNTNSGGWKWALGATLILGAAGGAAYFLIPRPAPPVVVQAPIAPVVPPGISDDDAALAYLDAGEKLAKERRFDPAMDMLAKAKELKIRRPDLNIRLTQLNDTLMTGVLLKKAAMLIKDKEWRGAMEKAKDALDRDPENKEAIQIIATARQALEPKIVDNSKNKEKARDGALTITTTPPAMVYVDDEPIGKSPIKYHAVTAGKHIIQVRAQGYRPSETEIKVQPKQTLTLVLPLAAAERSHEEGLSPAVFTAKTPPPAPSEPARPDPEPEAVTAPKPRPTPAPPPPSAAPPPATASAPPAPAPVVAKPVPAPAAPAGNPATVVAGGALMSATPKSPIPKPTLPRSYLATDAEGLAKACALVEATIVSQAGVSPEYARGITGPFRRLVGVNSEVYPVAMYYFLIREAALKHDNKTAAAGLASAHSSGQILKFKNLPAFERSL